MVVPSGERMVNLQILHDACTDRFEQTKQLTYTDLLTIVQQFPVKSPDLGHDKVNPYLTNYKKFAFYFIICAIALYFISVLLLGYWRLLS